MNLIDVEFRTNLDLLNEEWPKSLNAIPSVGHRFQSGTDHNGFKLELEVYGVTWVSREDGFGRLEWVPQIELHLPQNRFESIRKFYEWYAPKCNKSVSYFL